MMNAVAVYIADLLLCKAKNQKYDKEVYVYGIEVFLSNFLSILSIIIISCFLSDIYLGVVFLLIFCPLRMFTGGYHAKTYGKCFVVGNAAFLMTYGLNIFLWDKLPESILWCALLIMSLCILDMAPIINPLQEVSTRIQERSHRMAKYVLIMYSIFIWWLSFCNQKLMYMAVLTIGLVMLFMIISKRKGI